MFKTKTKLNEISCQEVVFTNERHQRAAKPQIKLHTEPFILVSAFWLGYSLFTTEKK